MNSSCPWLNNDWDYFKNDLNFNSNFVQFKQADCNKLNSETSTINYAYLTHFPATLLAFIVIKY